MIKSTGFANTSVVIHGGMIVVHWVMMRLSGIKSIFCFKRQIQVKMENVTKYTLPLKLFISAFPFLALLLMNYRGNSILCLLQTIWASFAFSISCDTFSVHGTTSCICKFANCNEDHYLFLIYANREKHTCWSMGRGTRIKTQYTYF